MAAIVSPLSGRGITPFHALKPWPLQCAKGTHGYGLPRVPDAIGAIDCTNAGLQRKARVWERGRGRRREIGESGRERESAEGMLPQGARLRLGQGYRNAPQEIPVKARAGLEECFSWELRVEAGWGRARGMFPQSTPLILQQKCKGLRGGRALPRPPSGSRMAADQVSVWGSASCRQGFGLPWGGDRRLKALLILSKNTSEMLCPTALSCAALYCYRSFVEKDTMSVVWLLFSVGTRQVHTPDMRP